VTPTVTPTATATATPTPTPTPTPTQPSGCSLSATLVPSCGVLFGGDFHTYGGTGLQGQHDAFVTGSDTHETIAHDYLTPGQTLTQSDVATAKEPGTLLLLNWKPAYSWASAGGGDASTNAGIDAMANSIKALGTTKVLLSVFHEPENDVSGGAAGCPSTIYKGGAGTPAEYRAMWANVEARFAALGVTNVVWSMNYMGFAGWNCMVNDLWPGNGLVDWVLWDPYAHNGGSFQKSVSTFYNELTTLSDPTHDYLSKGWGLGEFGTDTTINSEKAGYFTGMKSTLDAGTLPRLKLLSVFDVHISSGLEYRVAYDADGQWDAAELAAFKTVANSSAVIAGNSSAARN
jgi:hypothetical protein